MLSHFALQGRQRRIIKDRSIFQSFADPRCGGLFGDAYIQPILYRFDLAFFLAGTFFPPLLFFFFSPFGQSSELCQPSRASYIAAVYPVPKQKKYRRSDGSST
jgi:hypothetical protein